MELYSLDIHTIPIFSGLYQGNIIEYFTADAVGIGVIESGRPAGLLLAKVYGNTVAIDWLFILLEFAGKGIGRAVVEYLRQCAIKTGRINEIHVICTENQDMRGFWMACRFPMLQQPKTIEYETSLGEMIPIQRKDGTQFKALTQVSRQAFKNFHQMMYQAPYINCGAKLPIDPKDYLECSLAYEDDTKIKGLILIKKNGAELTIPFVYIQRGDEAVGMRMIAKAAMELIQIFGEQQKLVFGLLNESSIALTRKLFPGGRESAIYSGSLFLS